MLDFLCFTLYF